MIRTLAEEFTAVTPATVWIGYGMQRHVNGGANVRAIDAFVAMTGNIGVEGGGARYGHLHTWGFNYNAMLQKAPEGAVGIAGPAGTTSEFGASADAAAVKYSDRSLNINKTAEGILEANDPPVRMLWVACKNPFSQDFDRGKMEKAFAKLEMVVCADQFFNETVQHADIVLPVTTAFEEWNVDASYWHYWLSINQPAIKPMHEAKCDLEIATLLSRTINKMEPGSCTFPQTFDHKRWLDLEFNDGMAKMFGINSWDDLLDGPKKAIMPSSAAWYDRKIKTPSGKYEFKSELAAQNGHTALPEYLPEAQSTLPFHLFTRPQIARSLLRYRWLNLSGAREKARRNGWPGALFPWESAASGQEETPEFAAINIRTGIRQKVASALAEHHIVADIAWAVVAYWQATHDDAFMRNEGLTLLMETASFWMGRATEINGRLEIHDVIGPDEYTEHVNNNAYTNYLAWHNVACARQFMAMFGREDARFTENAGKFLARLWLPEADADGVIPQDDTFMAKPAIDLSRYKAKAGKQTILLDYSRAEVNEMQILKQADVVMLNYLLPERFTPQQCAANLAFYEPRTIHDSSLSKAIHGIVLARCGDTEGAYAFWRDGIAIDLGNDPHSSDDGIHAAATGAIWLGAIQGFAGLHISEGELHLAPKLPAHWQKLAFPLRWRDATMHITCEDDQLTIETTAPVTLTLWGKTLHVSGRKVCERKDFLASVNGTATTEGRHDA